MDAKNKPLQEALTNLCDMGITRTKDTHYEMVGTLSSVYKLMEHQKEITKLIIGDRLEKDLSSDAESDFKGGTAQDLKTALKGGVDMAVFLEKRNEFAKSGLLDKLRVALANVTPRRARVMSEHDGEWMYDRRWEIQPFQATTKVPGMGRTVDVQCDFSINASANADSINRYGAMVWAISDLIEQAGITTRILYTTSGARTCSEGQVSQRIILEIKKPGQYLAPNMLAGVCTANFFRRAGFAFIGLSANLHKRAPAWSLGSAVEEKRRIAFSEGKLVLSPSSVHATNDEIEQAILQTIRTTRGAA